MMNGIFGERQVFRRPAGADGVLWGFPFRWLPPPAHFATALWALGISGGSPRMVIFLNYQNGFASQRFMGQI